MDSIDQSRGSNYQSQYKQFDILSKSKDNHRYLQKSM